MKSVKELIDIIERGIGDDAAKTKEFIENYNPDICNYVNKYGMSAAQKAFSPHKKYDIAKNDTC